MWPNKMPKYYNIFNQNIQNEMFKHLIITENHTQKSDDII